ncbi:MAG TPA: hypothetical protein VFI38_14995 [Candidatus Acidoferrum sp.]|nr:hypothetical protein [Candidatus Acidoferrum sp.]
MLALTIDTLTTGTAGGYYPERFGLEIISTIRGPVQYKVRTKQVLNYAPSTAQLLSTIRDVFALRMSEVAQIFGVSRRAVYDWLEGVTPKPETTARIYALSKYADELKTSGLSSIEHFIYRPVVGDRSLLDLLKSGDNIEEAIVVIKRTAAEEEKNRRQSGRRTSETSTASVDGFDEVSTPISE